MYDLHSEFIINKTEKTFTHLRTGNMILLAGIDDPEKIKSITGITSVWVEEATEFNQNDIDQLILRVRGKTENYKQFIFSFNPIDVDHWIKTRIESIECIEIVTTYLQNAFLDQEYIDYLTGEASKNKYLYDVYVMGAWGSLKTGGEFYKGFDMAHNTGEYEHDPGSALHITFDFNVLPYVTLNVWQIEGLWAYQIDEILAEDPMNSTRGACVLFKEKYPVEDNAGLFFYGDPSGRHRDTRTDQGFNDYDLIYKELAQYHPVERVARAAPPLAIRGQFMNSIFEGLEPVKMFISKVCNTTINEYNHVKQNAEGGKLKEKVKTESGAVYEKYGHTSDANDYFICEAFKTEFDTFKKGSKDLKASEVKVRNQAKSKY